MFEDWCKEKDLDPINIDNLKFAEFIKEKRRSSKFPKESEKLVKSSVASIYGKELTDISWIGKNPLLPEGHRRLKRTELEQLDRITSSNPKYAAIFHLAYDVAARCQDI